MIEWQVHSGNFTPMLATLSDKAPDGEWTFEPKLDGLRCIATRSGDEIHLWSRNHLSFDRRFPHVIAALRALPAEHFVFDGELVAFEGEHTSFSALQQLPSWHQLPSGLQDAEDGAPVYFIFDMLHLLGRDTTQLPIEERKALLAKAVVPTGTLRLVEPLEGNGHELFAAACKNGWEGIVAKRSGSPYSSGRSRNWVKLKCSSSQELVVGGWTEPRGSRKGIGALLVGFYDDEGFRYAGKVGTGFSDKTLNELHGALTSRENKSSSFVDAVKEKTAHWCTPELVAQVAFMEWTSDGKLRHPRFEGLRPDKDPKTVRRETSSG